MNEQDKRKANMEAAKLLGKDENYALHIATTGSVMLVSLDGLRQWVGTFSLFENAEDRDEVVQTLIKRGSFILYSSVHEGYYAMPPESDSIAYFESYPDVVAAAVLEVTNE